VRAGDGIRSTPVSYWLVVDHPYATLTGHDGSFRLANLPAGKVELSIWHETTGWLVKNLSVSVSANGVTELPAAAMTLEQLKNR
jgi:hypothetical protein